MIDVPPGPLSSCSHRRHDEPLRLAVSLRPGGKGESSGPAPIDAPTDDAAPRESAVRAVDPAGESGSSDEPVGRHEASLGDSGARRHERAVDSELSAQKECFEMVREATCE